MTPTKELKKRAREALAEKMGTVILAFVVLIILSFGSGWISNTLFPENSKLNIALGYVFSFIISILVNVISAGLLYMYLNIARNKEFSLNDLFYFFKKYPDRVITATFVLAFINVLTMLPYTIYGYSLPTDTSDMNLLMEMAVKSGVLMIIGTVVYEIITIPLEMTYYILADNPQTKGMDALKESIEMMRGNFWRYFLLKLSFVPLMFLSVFTFYIALLWILPYMTMTETMFYHDLKGELKRSGETEPPTYGYQSEPYFKSVDTEADAIVNPEADQDDRAEKADLWNIQPDSESRESADNESTEQPQTAEEIQEEKKPQEEQPEEEDNEPKPWDEYFNRIK